MQTKETPIYDQPCKLVNKARKALKADKRSLPEIANQSKMPFYWLKAFSEGRYSKSPSANRVSYLYEFLTNKQIRL